MTTELNFKAIQEHVSKEVSDFMATQSEISRQIIPCIEEEPPSKVLEQIKQQLVHFNTFLQV